ncbi:hypothetical protein PIB30_093055 [Stylosanthes scabra]|uniref:Uncharacterized protein n=1 Tax=Stylosanthes scabra TaxID=79078 RepID=A0ABU6UTT5_9FABA|nr:hypothetical protein [Stylosanthes scabra]
MESSLQHYRHNERVQEFKSKYIKPMLVTALPKLESFFGETFTRIIHREVRKEIEGACAMNVECVRQVQGKIFFKCNSFGEPDVEHVVEFDRGEGMLKCECMWFKHREVDEERQE